MVAAHESPPEALLYNIGALVGIGELAVISGMRVIVNLAVQGAIAVTGVHGYRMLLSELAAVG